MPGDVYTNEEVNTACEDMKSMDSDEQKLQRMYDLLQKLDVEYDTISTKLGDESNIMARELVELMTTNFSEYITYNFDSANNIVWQAHLLLHMVYDFIVDGNTHEEIFDKYEQYKKEREAYIQEILTSRPQISAYPNPAESKLTINVDFAYELFGDPDLFIQVIGPGSGSLSPFDPLFGLPRKKQDSTIDYQENNKAVSENQFRVGVYGINGMVVEKSITPHIDKSGNIVFDYDVSNIPNGVYILNFTLPQYSPHSPTERNLVSEGLNTSGIFSTKIVVQH